jgi:hypothetical protein
MARDNVAIDSAAKYRDHKFAGDALRSPAVHSHAATVRSSSTRGTDMTTFSSRAAATAIASLLLMSSAFAQTATPAPAAKTAPAPKAAPATAEKKAEKPRTAASLQCSKDADAKGVHGKERKTFMSDCKKAAADKQK